MGFDGHLTQNGGNVPGGIVRGKCRENFLGICLANVWGIFPGNTRK